MLGGEIDVAWSCDEPLDRRRQRRGRQVGAMPAHQCVAAGGDARAEVVVLDVMRGPDRGHHPIEHRWHCLSAQTHRVGEAQLGGRPESGEPLEHARTFEFLDLLSNRRAGGGIAADECFELHQHRQTPSMQ